MSRRDEPPQNETTDASQPWQTPARELQQPTATEPTTASDEDPSTIEPKFRPEFGGIDWERQEIGPSYPTEANYYCNECVEFHTDSLRDLKFHVQDEEAIEWPDYVQQYSLHRCVCCSDPLESPKQLVCTECDLIGDIRIPCRNCGETRVHHSDPFCSSQCAAEYMQASNGAGPGAPPTTHDEEWFEHPHRLLGGVPSSVPFVANHTYTCRECHHYGADELHNLAVHVAESHEIGWPEYIRKYRLRCCRVCDEPLYSLFPLYCGEECQQADPDPPRECTNPSCDNGVERKQKYCSRDCHSDADF